MSVRRVRHRGGRPRCRGRGSSPAVRVDRVLLPGTGGPVGGGGAGQPAPLPLHAAVPDLGSTATSLVLGRPGAARHEIPCDPEAPELFEAWHAAYSTPGHPDRHHGSDHELRTQRLIPLLNGSEGQVLPWSRLIVNQHDRVLRHRRPRPGAARPLDRGRFLADPAPTTPASAGRCCSARSRRPPAPTPRRGGARGHRSQPSPKGVPEPRFSDLQQPGQPRRALTSTGVHLVAMHLLVTDLEDQHQPTLRRQHPTEFGENLRPRLPRDVDDRVVGEQPPRWASGRSRASIEPTSNRRFG